MTTAEQLFNMIEKLDRKSNGKFPYDYAKEAARCAGGIVKHSSNDDGDYSESPALLYKFEDDSELSITIEWVEL